MDSGGWKSTFTDESGSRKGTTEIKDGKTTSDEEDTEEDGGVGMEWEIRPHHHHHSLSKDATVTTSIPSTAATSALPASPTNATATSQTDSTKESTKSHSRRESDDSDDVHNRIPGAFVWDAVKKAL